MNQDDLAFMTVKELAPLIESKQVSPVDLVEAQLARIEALDGVLRSFIYVNADQARAAAKAAEVEIAAGHYRGPLHGVTVAHKDIIDVEGLPTTGASRIMSEYIAKEDATVQARLKAAGAICIGKLNLVEFASGSMGVYGYGRNPHNLAAFPGGSSSGSGIAAAAGLSTIVTGTDTGGSVRGPSCYCALAGLRPTYGRVSRYGCVPLSWSQDSIGPMGRSVADVAMMLGAMSGADRHDKTAANVTVPDFTAELEKGIKGLRIGVYEPYFLADLDPEVDAAVREALRCLESLGAEIKPVSLPASEFASAPSWTIAYSEGFVYHHEHFKTRAHDYTPAFYLKITAAGMMSAPERILSQQVRQLVTHEFNEAMREVDLILTPTSRTLAPMMGRPAAKIEKTLRFTPEMSSPTRPVSMAGYPGFSVPIGFAADGTGIGMQLVGRPFDESTLFRVGYAYEKANSWSTKRPPAFPDEIPPAHAELAVAAPPVVADDKGPITRGWVMDMAKLLGYEFVTEDDAAQIAAMLIPVKEQMAAIPEALNLQFEMPTRPAGRM